MHSPTLKRSIRTSSQRRKEEFNRALIGYALVGAAAAFFVLPAMLGASTSTVMGLSLVLAPAMMICAVLFVAWRR